MCILRHFGHSFLRYQSTNFFTFTFSFSILSVLDKCERKRANGRFILDHIIILHVNACQVCVKARQNYVIAASSYHEEDAVCL